MKKYNTIILSIIFISGILFASTNPVWKVRIKAENDKLTDTIKTGYILKKSSQPSLLPSSTFDGKKFAVIKSNPLFDIKEDFTIQATILLPKLPTASYARIIAREKFNPRGGYALALRRDGSFVFWASGRTWVNSNLKVNPGTETTVGVMAYDGRLFLFVDDKFSRPSEFDGPVCLPTDTDIRLGNDFTGTIKDIAISDTAVYRDKVSPGNNDWKLPASLRDNNLRGDVVLNGWWAGRPAGSTKKYLKTHVPDIGRKPKIINEFYREFELPVSWKKRKITLEIGNCSHDAAIFINGKKLTTIKSDKRFIETELPVGNNTKKIKLLVQTGMISDDVWLRSYPRNETTITESFITTSFQQKNIRIRLAGKGKVGETMIPTVNIYELNSDTPIKTITAKQPVRIDVNGNWQADLTAEWKNPKLWSRWHPNLYAYTAQISNKNGDITDKTLKREFGFREVWIENGRFIVNGVPISICDDAWEGTLGYKNIMRKQAIVMLKNLKSMGITGGFRIRCDALLNAGDEIGMLFEVDAGSMVRFNIWDPNSGLTPMTGKEDTDDIRRKIIRWREHPSIISWRSNAPYCLTGMHPDYAGQNYDPWFYYPANKNVERAKAGQQIFKQMVGLMQKLDPSRIVGTHVSPYSPIDGLTRYLCDNLDLQEREEYFDHWFRSDRPKIIWVHEFGIPIMNHYFIRRIDHQMGHTGLFPKIHLEAAARLFGQQAYLFEDNETISKWGSMPYMEFCKLPGVQKAVAEQAYHIWRSWRTYGANLSAHHILNKHGFEYIASNDPIMRYGFSEENDPRISGLAFIPQKEPFPIKKVDRLLPAGKAILRGMNPLLAYIGGPDTQFNNKDHLYFSGKPIRKALILLNDFDDDVTIDGKWELTAPDGTVVTNGIIHDTVKAGHRALTDFPIEFTSPNVTERTDFKLRIKVSANLPGALEDTFDITVFPPHKQPKINFTGNMWCMNISDDATHETRHAIINRENAQFLKSAGLHPSLVKGLRTFIFKGNSPKAAADLYNGRHLVTEGIPQPGDLLIIPRQTLLAHRDNRQKTLRILEDIGLDDLVKRGLRVIIFEQDLPNIFGIVTEDTRPRRVFMSASDHPVFEGLMPSDLWYWTGKSTLVTAITPTAHTERSFPDRVWHSSTDNSVATRTMIRPQVGAVRALAVSGFDLAESPLLEVTRGKGRILFCTMNVTTRYGKDPAATRLVDNMFKYMTTVKEPDPELNTVATVPVNSPNVVVRKNLFRAAVPQGCDGWGITQGELFFRESIYTNNWITRKLPDFSIPVFAGTENDPLPKIIRKNPATGLYESTLDITTFKTGWSQRKVLWVKNTLIVNQGGSLPNGPALKHHGRLTDLYPIVWVENFVHPYTANIW